MKAFERSSGSSIELFSKISSEQGVSQFWRGNNANIYKSFVQLGIRIFFYDKIKGYFMPFDTHKYRGFDYYWRAASAFSACTALTTLFVYPFDTIHTRIAADLTPKGKPRLFTTTFDCFNRTHLDEGRVGLFKGYQLAIVSSVLRASLTLPIYDSYR